MTLRFCSNGKFLAYSSEDETVFSSSELIVRGAFFFLLEGMLCECLLVPHPDSVLGPSAETVNEQVPAGLISLISVASVLEKLD